jgi:hypothetical protein
MHTAESMKTATPSATSGCEVACETTTVCRPRYFPRQIITPDELTLEQDYFRARLRWHNLLLHGWGVVCGAKVCLKPKEGGNGHVPWQVVVDRGYAIGPCGDEIILDCPRTVDLRTSGVTGTSGDPCGEPVDVWCTDVYEAPTEDVTLYIAVRYKQTTSRPVRVQPIGCGCDDSRCEYSRWCDGYEIGVLRSCPPHHTNPPAWIDSVWTGPPPECPEKATSPWVGLAEVNVAVDGTVRKIDNCACRRIVGGLAGLWRMCDGGDVEIREVYPPDPLAPGDTSKLTVKGVGFAGGMSADLGPGVTVEHTTVLSGTEAKIELVVNSDVIAGPRTLTLRNLDCSTAAKEGAVTIAAGHKADLTPPDLAGASGAGRRRRRRPRG